MTDDDEPGLPFDEPAPPTPPKTVYQLHQEELEQRARRRGGDTVYFDGETYEPHEDRFRLLTELQRTWVVMLDGAWHTLRYVAALVGGSEAGVSARLRDFRKERFGGHQVDRRRVQGGLFEYRLQPRGPLRVPRSSGEESPHA